MVLPVNTWPPAIPQASELNLSLPVSYPDKSVLECPLPTVRVSSLVWATWLHEISAP